MLFPLLGPVTGTIVILNVIFIWNDFMTPLLYLSGSRNLTLPVAIQGSSANMRRIGRPSLPAW